MALKDWKKTQKYPNDIVWENKKKSLWVNLYTTWQKEYVVRIKLKNDLYFKSKTKAMKYLKSFMKKH